MRLDEQLKDVESACFVGRTEELRIMLSHAAGDWNWQWLHIHGQGGIGKSALLRRFRSELEGMPCFSLDGGRNKEDALEKLAVQLGEIGTFDHFDSDPDVIVERLNQLSRGSGCNFVLLIDAFEE
ncbi:ATP-binding protein [Paenibacillus antri]|uniref:ATP-binding protein n=1 Tax=Paenibacillus antri TaxID=2582848 RepID=A0A5R9G3N7_9BACL|nr:ATP-binding protein [Paenibacillus antri]TLS48906.1 ATP-binding protein [Paenibacillus antri]